MNETLLPGKYYLGDPVNVLPSKILVGIWGNEYNHNNGKYNIYEKEFVVHNTNKGDGKFNDTKNRTYFIDSGVLGLIHIDLIEDKELLSNKFGHIFEFKKKVNFIYDGGVFYIKSSNQYIKIK